MLAAIDGEMKRKKTNTKDSSWCSGRLKSWTSDKLLLDKYLKSFLKVKHMTKLPHCPQMLQQFPAKSSKTRKVLKTLERIYFCFRSSVWLKKHRHLSWDFSKKGFLLFSFHKLPELERNRSPLVLERKVLIENLFGAEFSIDFGGNFRDPLGKIENALNIWGEEKKLKKILMKNWIYHCWTSC